MKVGEPTLLASRESFTKEVRAVQGDQEPLSSILGRMT